LSCGTLGADSSGMDRGVALLPLRSFSRVGASCSALEPGSSVGVGSAVSVGSAVRSFYGVGSALGVASSDVGSVPAR
jgi:hypothetical protein